MPEQHIKGWEDLDRKLMQLANPREQRAVIRSALNYATTPVMQAARTNVPQGSDAHKTYKGRLVSAGFASRSIKRMTKIEGMSIVTRIGLAKEAFYALFFETGTRFLRRRPWLERSLDENQKKAIDRFASKMRDRIKKIAAKR